MIDLPPLTTVETQRLRLEPFDLAHAPALNAINNEPAVMRFLSDGDPETLADTQAAMTRSRTRWRDLGYSWWAIIERASDRIIGAACLQHIANVPEAGWKLAGGWARHTPAMVMQQRLAWPRPALPLMSSARIMWLPPPIKTTSPRTK